MTFKKIFVTVFVMTLVSFGLFGVSIGIIAAKENQDPFKTMSEKMIKNGDMKEITMNRDFDKVIETEVDIVTISTDVEILPSPNSTLKIEVQGKILKDQGNDIGLDIKQDGQKFEIVLKGAGEDGNSIKLDLGKIFQLSYSDLKMKVYLPSSIKSVKTHTISGDVTAHHMTAPQAELHTINGDLELSGDVEKLNVETISGDLKASLNNSSPNIEIASTSGDSTLKFINGADLLVQFKSISGDISLMGKEIDDTPGTKNFERKIGTGKGRVTISTTSGDFEVL